MEENERENTCLMYTLLIRDDVFDDIKQAYDWYEEQRIGLGEDLLLSLEASYAVITRHPHMYPSIYKQVKRHLIRRFPYGVFYVVDEDKKEVIVLAVLHTKSHPTRWISRTTS